VQTTVDDPDSLIHEPFILLDVDADRYPNGITVTKAKIKTHPSSTYSVDFENWTDPADAAPTNIVTVATAASQEAETTSITNPSVPAGNIIYVDIPTTDIDELWVGLTIRIDS
jgi:hypothetical protein